MHETYRFEVQAIAKDNGHLYISKKSLGLVGVLRFVIGIKNPATLSVRHSCANMWNSSKA